MMHTLLLAILLGADPGQLTINGPSVVKNEQVARVTVTGLPKFETLDDLYQYRLVVKANPPANDSVYDLGQSVAYDLTTQAWKLQIDFITDSPGVYVIIVVDCGTCQVLDHRLDVGGTPKPDPDPDKPVPDGLWGLTRTSYDNAMRLASSVESQIAAVGQNYSLVAGAITLGKATTYTEARNMLGELNRSTVPEEFRSAWGAFQRAIAVVLESHDKDLDTVSNVAEAYRDIGTGLNLASEKRK